MARQAKPEPQRQMLLNVGKRMAMVREIREPNRAAFAERIGVDTSTLTKVETGDRYPTLTLVRDYALRLNVPVDFLLFNCVQLRAWDPGLLAELARVHPEIGQPPQDTDNSHPGNAPQPGSSPRRRPAKRREPA
jgi:transcriptional regulator with XRE-family HTH domain